MESGSSSRFGNCNQACQRAASAMMTHPSVSSGWTLKWVAVVKSHDCLHSVKIQPGGLFGAVGRDGMNRGCVFSSVRPCGVFSGLDGAGYHAVRRVWKLRRHGRYLAARRVRTRSSLRETDL